MNFKYASQSVTTLHEAGATVLAGTDANTQPGARSKVSHGKSLHQEFELLVEAGMSKFSEQPRSCLRKASGLMIVGSLRLEREQIYCFLLTIQSKTFTQQDLFGRSGVAALRFRCDDCLGNRPAPG
jgi:hypothetical protein